MIIDTHVHIGTSLNFNMTEADVLYSMKEYNIDKVIISNSEAASHDHDRALLPEEYQVGAAECLKRCIRFARENPERIYVAAWVKPSVEKVSAELEKLIAENLDIVKAIKFHPYHSGISFSSPECQEYIRLAEKYSLVVLTHTGDCEDDSPRRVYEMAREFPKVNFVMVHLGLGTDNKEAIELCSKCKNIWGDTTWVSTASALEFIEKCGDDRLLFGSDNPIDGKDTYRENGYGERSLYQEYFGEFRNMVSEETYEKIMYKNAEKLFGI